MKTHNSEQRFGRSTIAFSYVSIPKFLSVMTVSYQCLLTQLCELHCLYLTFAFEPKWKKGRLVSLRSFSKKGTVIALDSFFRSDDSWLESECIRRHHFNMRRGVNINLTALLIFTLQGMWNNTFKVIWKGKETFKFVLHMFEKKQSSAWASLTAYMCGKGLKMHKKICRKFPYLKLLSPVIISLWWFEPHFEKSSLNYAK